MNQPYARVNQPYATLTLASALHEMFGEQLYKNNARVLLSNILSILNLDWLQHARSVRGVYEIIIISSIYKAHLISQRTSQCASLLLRYQENCYNQFASTREQLAKCMPFWYLHCNISNKWYLPDALRWMRQMRVKCLAQAHNTRNQSVVTWNFFGSVQISIWGPSAP